MKKLCVIALLLCTCAAPGLAQDSKFDLFGGYSYVHSNPGSLPAADANGWEASLTYNWNRWLGLTADVDGHYCCGQSMHDFLFGPQIRLGHKVSPYVHGLVGISHGSSTGGFSDNVLAYAFGGGVDIQWADRLSVRLIQVDYLGTQYGGFTQNNVRVSAGLVFHFGRK